MGLGTERKSFRTCGLSSIVDKGTTAILSALSGTLTVTSPAARAWQASLHPWANSSGWISVRSEGVGGSKSPEACTLHLPQTPLSPHGASMAT